MVRLKKTPAFISAYRSLNPQQKQAVNNIEGPVLVVAGPGTGKTQTLSLRIANILLSTDVGPDAILALTFTDAAAVAMRTRLAQFIGPVAYQVNIYTFHGFALEVIRNNPDLFSQFKSQQPLSDLKRYQFFQQVLDSHSFKLLRPANSPSLYLYHIDMAIQNLKQEAVSPATFEALLTHQQETLVSQKEILGKTRYRQQLKELNKNQELAQIYRLYQQYLQETGQFDFADIINSLQSTLNTNSSLLSSLQERFLYFLVDEYQDTNTAQNKLLFTLTQFWQDKANLFVVGDPNQSIYRFQGASLENMFEFLHRYPSALVINLQTSYRSPQPLLDAAHKLISHNTFTTAKLNLSSPALQTAFTSSSSSSPLIQVIHTPTATSENLFILQQIKKLIQQGVSSSQIAIIYRQNNDALPLLDLFNKHQLSYKIYGKTNLLTDPFLNQLLQILHSLDDIQQTSNSLALFNILYYPFFKLPPYDITLITRYAAEHNLSLLDIINDESLLQQIKVDNPQQFLDFAHQLLHWLQLSKTQPLPLLLEKIISESGFLHYLLKQTNAYHLLTKLNHFFSFAKTLAQETPNLTLNQFLQDLEFMMTNNLSLSVPSEGFVNQAITLTTAHSAKGLEWDYVFIYNFIDTKWGNPQQKNLIKLPSSLLSYTDISKKEKNEDERRLFYVALTRARRQVFLTYADEYQQNSHLTPASPSMFLYELPKSLYHLKTVSFDQQSLLPTLASHFAPPPLSSKEADFLTHKLQSFALSPTALNNYLLCPYKFKLTNLLRVPKLKEPYLAFGTAIHAALEDFYSHLNLHLTPPSQEFLLSRFTYHLNKELLSDLEKQKRLQEGQQILQAYYHLNKPFFKPSLFTEKKLTVHLQDIKLTGKVDRVDLVSEKDKLIRLVDYKTGTPRSKNYIEGKTKDSHGDLKRQLIFYQLLFSLHPNFHFQVKEVVIDFVKSAKDGKRDLKSFVISPSEVADLKQLIISTTQKIRNLEFPKTTDTSVCYRCPFRFHCWPQGIPSHSSSL